MSDDRAIQVSGFRSPLGAKNRLRKEPGEFTVEPERVGEPVAVPVTVEHEVVKAWQTARTLAEADGFGRVLTYYVVTSVAELANNLVLHASRGGTISVVLARHGGRRGIEVIAEDEGPGIADVSRAIQDGFSTTGSLGSGLPGVVRLMDECEITSTIGIGTRIVARKWQPCA